MLRFSLAFPAVEFLSLWENLIYPTSLLNHASLVQLQVQLPQKGSFWDGGQGQSVPPFGQHHNSSPALVPNPQCEKGKGSGMGGRGGCGLPACMLSVHTTVLLTAGHKSLQFAPLSIPGIYSCANSALPTSHPQCLTQTTRA